MLFWYSKLNGFISKCEGFSLLYSPRHFFEKGKEQWYIQKGAHWLSKSILKICQFCSVTSLTVLSCDLWGEEGQRVKHSSPPYNDIKGKEWDSQTAGQRLRARLELTSQANIRLNPVIRQNTRPGPASIGKLGTRVTTTDCMLIYKLYQERHN